MKIYESIFFWQAIGILVVMVLGEYKVIVDENYSNEGLLILFLVSQMMAMVDCILYMVQKLYDKHNGDFE